MVLFVLGTCLAQGPGAPAYSGNYAMQLDGVDDYLLCDRCGDQITEAVQTTNYAFNDALDGGDVQLLSNGDGEDIFHMLKIERVDPTESCS